jgi:hypothetical protein
MRRSLAQDSLGRPRLAVARRTSTRQPALHPAIWFRMTMAAKRYQPGVVNIAKEWHLRVNQI